MIDKHIETKLNLIRDTLLGIGYHSQNPEAMLFPFLDSVMLLHQKELVLALWKHDVCVDVFLKDLSFLTEFEGSVQNQVFAYCRKIQNSIDKKNIIKLGGEPYGLSIHEFRPLEDILQAGVSLKVHEDATELTFKLFDKVDDDKNHYIDDEFYKSIGQAIEKHISRAQDTKPTDEEEPVLAIAIADAEIKELLEPMRLALDEILIDIGKIGDRLTLPSTLPNIFVAIRVYRKMEKLRKEKYDYTAMLMLQEKTKDGIENWCKTGTYPDCISKGKGYKDCVNALQQILGDTRVSADLVFASGIITFGVPTIANKKAEVEKEGQSARDTEKCIYFEMDPYLTYFPIHIGGSPWLAMYTLTKNSEEISWETWRHNYLFYRQVLQNVPGLIKQRSQQIYLYLTSEKVIDAIRRAYNNSSFLEAVNLSMIKVAQVYPFPLIKFIEWSEECKHELSVLRYGKFGVSIKRNPFFMIHADTVDICDNIIIKHCQEALTHFDNQQQYIADHNVGRMTHVLNVPLSILKQLAEANGDQVLFQHAEIMSYLHDAAAMMINEDKRNKIISDNQQILALDSCINQVKLEYESVRSYFKHKHTNKVKAPSSLLECINMSTNPVLMPSVNVRYFRPLMMIALHELLANSIKHRNTSDPDIAIHLCWSNSRLFLEVVSSTLKTQHDLNTLLHRLNSPEPDTIGITTLHLLVKGYWHSRADRDSCIVWEKCTDIGKQKIVARVLIAEEVLV